MTDKSPLDEMKETIVATAAEAVVEQMTSAQMRKISEQVIEEVLSGIKTDEYSSLGRLVKDKAEKMLKEYLGSDEITASFRVAIRQGVDEAMKKMPEEIKGRVVDLALEVMTKSLGVRR